jgi:hypothetical protein
MSIVKTILCNVECSLRALQEKGRATKRTLLGWEGTRIPGHVSAHPNLGELSLFEQEPRT